MTIPASGNLNIDALATASWNTTMGKGVSLTYSFFTSFPADGNPGDGDGFKPMTTAQQQAVRETLAKWATVANITFTEVASGGKIGFGTNDQGSTSSGYAYYPWPSKYSAVYINNTYAPNYDFTPGTFGPSVLVHEVGHALGLKHPGNYNAGGGGTAGPYLPTELDNNDYTIMSYSSGKYKYAGAPMVLDIQAIQYLYGANKNYRIGNDTYKFTDTSLATCIWDAGGINTMDFTACTGATLIDMVDGRFSDTVAARHNVSLAYGVKVQVAVAGNGGSTVYGNELGNTITGGTGRDTIYTGGGNDVIKGGGGNDYIFASLGSDTVDGGDGDDKLVLSGKFADYQGTRAEDGGLRLVHATNGATTAARNVEVLVFGDGERRAADLYPNGGNDADNVMVGTAGNDSLSGMGGNDTLDGLAGNDRLDGGTGNDILKGGTGSDTMIGGSGNDTYYVDAATDVVTELAQGGADTVITSLNSYTLAAELEHLQFNGTGDFTGTGNGVTNFIVGGKGNDKLYGQGGDDGLTGGAGNDLLDGGAGTDTAYVTGKRAQFVVTKPGTDVILTDRVSGQVIVLRDMERVAFSDQKIDVPDLLKGTIGSGDDVVQGTSGDDILDGLAGADTMFGLGGNDSYAVDNIGDVVVETAGAGTDTVNVAIASANASYSLAENVENGNLKGALAANLTGNDGVNVLTGNEAVNTLAGLAGDDVLDGAAGNDKLDGGAGNDVLKGGSGNDVLIGGAGNDTYYIDATGDAVTELALGGADTVITSLNSYTLVAELEHLQFNGSGNFIGTGTGVTNFIVGGKGNDTLYGLGGDDGLTGGAGNDLLDGGAGTDTAYVSGKRAQFTVTRPSTDVVLTDKASGQVIVLRDMERVAFADQKVDVPELLKALATVTLTAGQAAAGGMQAYHAPELVGEQAQVVVLTGVSDRAWQDIAFG